MSAYPDVFGASGAGLTMIDPANGVTYSIGFGPNGPDGIPTVVWQATFSWGRAKSVLGGTWADAKRKARTWGQAKALVQT